MLVSNYNVSLESQDTINSNVWASQKWKTRPWDKLLCILLLDGMMLCICQSLKFIKSWEKVTFSKNEIRKLLKSICLNKRESGHDFCEYLQGNEYADALLPWKSL